MLYHDDTRGTYMPGHACVFARYFAHATHGEIVTIMVKRCVAAGCSNTYNAGVSLFLFPKDLQLCKKWTDQVKRTQDKWEGPSDHSVLCSCHFEEDRFEPEAKLADSLGFVGNRKLRLKADAVPMLFDRPVPKRQTVVEPVAGPSQPARKKLREDERRRVSSLIVNNYHKYDRIFLYYS